MKKAAFILAVLTVFFSFISCNRTDADPFSVFNSDFTVNVSANYEGSECEFVYSSKEKSAVFTSPGEVAGYTLRLDGETVLLSYGDTEIEVSTYAGGIIRICDAIFSAHKDSITEISARELGAETVTVVKAGEKEYLFTADGVPIAVSGYEDGMSFEMRLSDFKSAAK